MKYAAYSESDGGVLASQTAYSLRAVVLHCASPIGTFIDLYIGRVTTASSSSSRPSVNYTVAWRHEDERFVIDGTKAGNFLADINDTA
jgi:hypothetical protein